MTMNSDGHIRELNREMLRSTFQSLFWHVLNVRKRESGLTLKALAEKLGVDKSYVSRSFSSPPNWQINKISDFSDSLGVELMIVARDVKSGRIYTPTGDHSPTSTSTDAQVIGLTGKSQQTNCSSETIVVSAQ